MDGDQIVKNKDLTPDFIRFDPRLHHVGIGSVPNSDFIKNLVQTNENRETVINHLTAQTSKEGVFAAGDVTDDPFKQNNISAGYGVRAALSAYNYILNIKKYSPCAEKDE
jgi:thioredoxin reductase (NADPH)